jgi:hypothetical protein
VRGSRGTRRVRRYQICNRMVNCETGLGVSGMLIHLVLLKPRPDLSSDDRQAFLDAFDRATRDAPSVRGVRIGTRVRHEAAYEAAAPDAADYLAMIEFDDVAGLQAYLHHPSHAELGRLFGTLLARAFVYDFEMNGPGGGVDLPKP